MRGPGQNIIAYVLYGDAVRNNEPTKYFFLLSIIPPEAEKFYPGKYWPPDVSNLNLVQFHISTISKQDG